MDYMALAVLNAKRRILHAFFIEIAKPQHKKPKPAERRQAWCSYKLLANLRRPGVISRPGQCVPKNQRARFVERGAGKSFVNISRTSGPAATIVRSPSLQNIAGIIP